MLVASLDDLAEPFKSRVVELQAKLENKDLPFVMFESRRSFKRQAELFDKGRELIDGLMVVKDHKLIVTKARSGESAHNWGLAADFILDLKHDYWKQWHLKPDGPWDDGKGAKVIKPNVINVWHQFGALAKEVELQWGGSWQFRDLPHVELPNWKTFRPHNYKAVVEREMSK